MATLRRRIVKIRVLLSAAIIGASLLLIGCYESTGITVHQPGVYKGAVDPLVALSAQPAHQQRLQERFTLVQTDR